MTTVRRIIVLFLLLGVCPPASAQVGNIFSGAPASGETVWSQLKVGAGGYITGIDIAADGTKVNRADTYGGYWWNGTKWVQCVTVQSMPAGTDGLDRDAGVNEIRIAPSNTSRFYMNYRGQMFRSDNSCAAWTLLSNYASVTWDGNDTHLKTQGPYIAVDPANADVVYASTPSGGLRVSTDAGATWSSVSAVGAGSVPAGSFTGVGGGNLIAFDPASSVSGGKTQGIYATRYGTGVYHSTDAGENWTLLNTANMPTTFCRVMVDHTGVVWITNAATSTGPPCQGTLFKYASGAWTNITPGGQGARSHSVAVDPANANNVWVLMDSGDIITSSNAGSSWTDPTFNNTLAATDIPWLVVVNSSYMTAGDIKWDASTSRWYQSAGLGVWQSSSLAATMTWTSQSAGIEQLVNNKIVSIPSGATLVASWDKPIFRTTDPDVYPSTMAGCASPNVTSLVMAWDVDYASATPSTVVAICNFGVDRSGRSTDGGASWTAFGSLPTGVPGTFLGGSIAASTSSNFVWIPCGNSLFASYTTDAGATWTQSTATGTKTTGSEGWCHDFRFKRQIVCADRVTPNKFYAYYNGTANSDGAGSGSDGNIAGIYVSTDSGATFGKAFAGRPDGNNNNGYAFDFFWAKLRCVPGNAGHLFFAAGPVGGSTSGGFWRSTDAGATLQQIPNVTEVYAFGFGAVAPGGSYPTIYIAGYVGGTAAGDFGIWRSIDEGASWTRISDGFPLGNFSQIISVEGDANTYGTVHVGTIGSGALYGKLNFLLARDLGAANDNSPMWLDQAA